MKMCGISFVVLRVMYNLIGPRHIEDGRTWSNLIRHVAKKPHMWYHAWQNVNE